MDKPTTPGPPQNPTQQPHRVHDRNPLISSASLFGVTDEVLISHQGEHYRLRRTRSGKLILTK